MCAAQGQDGAPPRQISQTDVTVFDNSIILAIMCGVVNHVWGE